jgi:hypothetical protein
MADPEKWTPDKPLSEKDDEDEVQREARARARLNFLVTDYSKPATPAPKKRKGIFSDRD